MPVSIKKIYEKIFDLEFVKKMDSKQIPKWFLIGGLFLSLAGFFNASYLTFEHFSSSQVTCPLVTPHCQDVLTSKYSEIFSIPTALFGSFYYFFVFALIFLISKRPKVQLFLLLFGLTSFGFIFSVLLVYLQFGVLHAVCPYCMFSASVSALLFFMDVLFFYKKNVIVEFVSDGLVEEVIQENEII